MAYKALVSKYHPDRNPDCQRSLRAMQAINASYQVLRDPAQRRAHDLWIRENLGDDMPADPARQPNVTPTHSYRQDVPSSRPQERKATPPSQPRDPSPPQRQSQTDNGTLGVVVVLVVAASLFLGIGFWVFVANVVSARLGRATSSHSGDSSTPGKLFAPEPTPPPFSEPKQPLPRSGELVATPNQDLVAPLEINTTRGEHYFVKLSDAQTGTDVLTVFIRGGETVSLEAPLGVFIVKYASGAEWYGYDYLFGPKTEYSRADKTFVFSREISPANAQRLTDLNRQLIEIDGEFKQYLEGKGLGDKMTSFMFDQSDPSTHKVGLDRLDNVWWNENVFSLVRSNIPLYNSIVTRLNTRNRLSNEISLLRAQSESVKGHKITLYKVRGGNLKTESIDREEF